ncbi:MAG TPA: hypothetical protein VGQ21_00350, partial [Thermoanaerobaculia bacterium]|nr:hypothetical protein [Thermoanaerobaculia bacterium]
MDSADGQASQKGSSRLDRGDVVPLAIAIALGTILFVIARQRSLEPIIDTGRDLYIPGAILDGKKLYRDLVYFYPPLVPYLLALLTAVVGRSLAAYSLIGAAIAGVVGFTLYGAAKLVAGRLAAFVALLFFVGLNFTCTNGYGSNFLFPYAHEATFGILFLVLTIFFLLRYIFEAVSRPNGIAVVLFSLLASWCKIELAVIVAVAIIAAIVVHRFPKRYAFAYAGAMLVCVSAASLFFADAPPARHWLRDNIFPSTFFGGPTFYGFYARVFGLPRWRELLLDSAYGALVLCAFAACLALIERQRRPAVFALALVALPILAGIGGDMHFFQAWTLLQLALLIPAVRAPRRPLAILLFFSACSSARIFMKLAPAWYGFVLTVPTYLLIVYVLFAYLPERRLYSRRLSSLWLAFAMVIVGRGVWQQVNEYQRKSAPVGTRRGTFYEEPSRAAVLVPLLRAIETSGAHSLVVMPEGLALNYLTAVDTPLSYYTFTPIESAHPVIEQRVLDELSARRPEVVAVVSRHVNEFGYRGFGVDYDLRVAGFIRRQYRPIGRWQNGAN